MTVHSPQELAEHALRSSRSDERVVIVTVGHSANLRWAGNTLTTNGVMHRVGVTVVAFDHRPDGVAIGSVSGSATTAEEVARLTAAADAAASRAPVAPD